MKPPNRLNGHTMSRIWMALAALLLFGGVASAAERPRCQWDPDTGYLTPLSPGACFAEINGMQGVSFWTPTEGLIVGLFEAKNDFFTLLGNGTVRIHLDDQDSRLVFCTPTMINQGICNPAHDPELFTGTGKFSANGATGNPPGGERCPLTANFVGDVTGPGGEFKIYSSFVLVKDKTAPDGCRLLTFEVRLKAK